MKASTHFMIGLTIPAIAMRVFLAASGTEIRADRAWVWPVYFTLLAIGWLVVLAPTVRRKP